jgi:type VI secretion system protein ImpG
VCETKVRVSGGRGQGKAITLPPHSIQPIGFGSDEALLRYPQHAFEGYRLIQEYFVFPQKYLFVEVRGLRSAIQGMAGDRMEILLALAKAPNAEQTSITPGTFRLGCTPVINLFEQTAEPIRIDHTQFEYRIVPDVRKPFSTEVYSIDEVVWTAPHMPQPQAIQPFYSFKHGSAELVRDAYWYATRKPSERKNDSGTEMWLSLVDKSFDPTLPPAETLSIQVTCTNRDLPGKLPFSEERGDFELEGAAPISKIRALVKPTPTMRLPLTGEHQWRLISHLSLNYLSLVDGGETALREILNLYDFTDSAVIKQQIAGITSLTTRRVVRRPESLAWNGFCRGLEVTIEFDEQKYVGTGVFLFASVLERFIGLYAAVNTFTQLVAKTQQREEPVKRWPPRVGEQMLL